MFEMLSILWFYAAPPLLICFVAALNIIHRVDTRAHQEAIAKQMNRTVACKALYAALQRKLEVEQRKVKLLNQTILGPYWQAATIIIHIVEPGQVKQHPTDGGKGVRHLLEFKAGVEIPTISEKLIEMHKLGVTMDIPVNDLVDALGRDQLANRITHALHRQTSIEIAFLSLKDLSA